MGFGSGGVSKGTPAAGWMKDLGNVSKGSPCAKYMSTGATSKWGINTFFKFGISYFISLKSYVEVFITQGGNPSNYSGPPGAGFGSSGVVKGSGAADYHSSLANAKSGSNFASYQHAGAKGKAYQPQKRKIREGVCWRSLSIKGCLRFYAKPTYYVILYFLRASSLRTVAGIREFCPDI